MTDINKAFICQICADTIQIPTNIHFPCTKKHEDPCNILFCLRCVREYLHLNKPKRERPENVFCPYCRKTTINIKLPSQYLYQINHDLMRIMDTLYKSDSEVNTCRACNVACESQVKLHRHIRGDVRNYDQFGACPFSVAKCKWESCKYFGPRSSLTEHEVSCRFRPKCRYCHELLGESHSQESCPQRLIECNVCKSRYVKHCEIEEHLEGHFAEIITGFKYFNLEDKITEWHTKLTKSE